MNYDLFLDDAFLMRAPLSTIQQFLNLHPGAVRRVTLEVKASGVCTLHHKTGKTYVVTKPVGAR